jgi:hypothetical protein
VNQCGGGGCRRDLADACKHDDAVVPMQFAHVVVAHANVLDVRPGGHFGEQIGDFFMQSGDDTQGHDAVSAGNGKHRKRAL